MPVVTAARSAIFARSACPAAISANAPSTVVAVMIPPASSIPTVEAPLPVVTAARSKTRATIEAARMYEVHRQLPEPRLCKNTTSPAPATMFAAPGRIRLVALWVSVGVEAKRTIRSVPAGATPNDVIGPVAPFKTT